MAAAEPSYHAPDLRQERMSTRHGIADVAEFLTQDSVLLLEILDDLLLPAVHPSRDGDEE